MTGFEWTVIKVVTHCHPWDFVKKFSDKEWKWKMAGDYDESVHVVDDRVSGAWFVVNDGEAYLKNYLEVLTYARKQNARINLIQCRIKKE